MRKKDIPFLIIFIIFIIAYIFIRKSEKNNSKIVANNVIDNSIEKNTTEISKIDSNIIIASNVIKDDTLGEYNVKYEMFFEDEKLIEIITTMEFDSEETAEEYKNLMNLTVNSDIDLTNNKFEETGFLLEGKTVVIKSNNTFFPFIYNAFSQFTKDKIYTMLITTGYSIE